jgi:hypothetical protein
LGKSVSPFRTTARSGISVSGFLSGRLGSRRCPRALCSARFVIFAPAIAITASATELVNTPSFQLQNGHAKVPDLLRLSGSFWASYAPTSDPSQTRPDDGIEQSHSWAAFAGVADGWIADAGNAGPLLASDKP